MKQTAELLNMSIIQTMTQLVSCGYCGIECFQIIFSQGLCWRAGKHLWNSKDWLKSSYSLKFLRLNIHNLVFSVTDHLPGISKTSILSQKCNMWCLRNTVDTFKTSGFKVDFHTYNRLHSLRTTFKVLTPTTRSGLISVISPWFCSTPDASVMETWLMKQLRWCHLIQVWHRKQSVI